VLAVFLLVAVVPWTQVTPGESPFISALDRIGIPYLSPDSVFLFLVNSSGAIAPWLTWASIVAIVAIVASMAFVNDEATRAYLVPSLISLAIVVAVAFGRERLPGRRTSPAAGRRRGTTATA